MDGAPPALTEAMPRIVALALLAACSGDPEAPPAPPTGDGRAELVMPAVRDVRWETARCNDGTPFAFHVRLSTQGSRTWLLYLQGGGFCDDNAVECAGRGGTKISSEALGSDGELGPMPKDGGIMSPDPAINRVFADVNIAYGWYCSSDAWSGSTSERRPTTGDLDNGWYFSGRANARAMVEILIEDYGLDDADPETRVLFLGESAGAGGVMHNAGMVEAALPITAAAGRLKLVVDAGWHNPDWNHPDYPFGDSGESIAEVAIHAYEFFASAFDPDCEAAQLAAGLHPGRCVFGKYSYPYLSRLPMLVQQSSLDSYELEKYRLPYPPDDVEEMATLMSWRDGVLETLRPVAWLFSGTAPPYHTISTSPDEWTMSPPSDPDRAYREVLFRFWEDTTPGGERVVF